MESAQIQHQGQVQPRRALLAHGKGSTAHSHDVPDTGKMAASLRKVPDTASLIYTSQGENKMKGKSTYRVWNSSTEGWRRVVGTGPPLHPEGDGSQLHWSGVIKNYARALEG